MSQSDYLKHKRTSHILKENELSPVLKSGDYTDFKRYQISNTVVNDLTMYGELVPEGKNKIFDMELNVLNCPQFTLCKDTNTRSNRVPLNGIYSDPKPYRDIYIKDEENPVPYKANASKCSKKIYKC